MNCRDPVCGAIQRDAGASVALEEARLVEGEDTQLQQVTYEPGNPGPDTPGKIQMHLVIGFPATQRAMMNRKHSRLQIDDPFGGIRAKLGEHRIMFLQQASRGAANLFFRDRLPG